MVVRSIGWSVSILSLSWSWNLPSYTGFVLFLEDGRGAGDSTELATGVRISDLESLRHKTHKEINGGTRISPRGEPGEACPLLESLYYNPPSG